MGIEIGPDGTPIVTSSKVVTPSFEVPTTSSKSVDKPDMAKSGLENDDIARAMDEVMGRAETDEKSTSNTNEAILPERMSRVKLLNGIKDALKNGMDSQQQITAAKKIESLLNEYEQ